MAGWSLACTGWERGDCARIAPGGCARIAPGFCAPVAPGARTVLRSLRRGFAAGGGLRLVAARDGAGFPRCWCMASAGRGAGLGAFYFPPPLGKKINEGVVCCQGFAPGASPEGAAHFCCDLPEGSGCESGSLGDISLQQRRAALVSGSGRWDAANAACVCLRLLPGLGNLLWKKLIGASPRWGHGWLGAGTGRVSPGGAWPPGVSCSPFFPSSLLGEQDGARPSLQGCARGGWESEEKCRGDSVPALSASPAVPWRGQRFLLQPLGVIFAPPTSLPSFLLPSQGGCSTKQGKARHRVVQGQEGDSSRGSPCFSCSAFPPVSCQPPAIPAGSR